MANEYNESLYEGVTDEEMNELLEIADAPAVPISPRAIKRRDKGKEIECELKSEELKGKSEGSPELPRKKPKSSLAQLLLDDPEEFVAHMEQIYSEHEKETARLAA